MKVTSEQFKTKAENQYGAVYQIKALVDGIEITDEIQDFEYSSMTNPDGEFTFGNTCASQISFKIDTPSQNLTDREITIQQGIDIDGVVEYVSIGVFKVLKPENTRSVYTYQCVDRMVSRMEMPYFSELTYPATDIDILEEICNQVGIILDNADSLIPHTLQSAPSGYTRREIIGYMAQLQGKNAIINGNGNLELKWYNNVNYTIDDDRIYLDGSDSIKDETNYILGYIECSVSTSSDEEIKTIKSGTGNIGIKTENPFMTQEILDEVFSVIGGFSFMPVEVQFLGDFRLEVGDIVTVETYGKTYQVPIMQLSHSSDGGVVTTIESVAETDSENEISFTNPITKQMERYYAELVLINKALVNKLGVEELDAAKAEIEQAVIGSLQGQFADIHLANIDIADIGLFFANCGLIDRATIVDGHITGFLDAVEINANKITAGTLIADRILLSGGDKGVLYALNNLGELTSANVDSLDGYVITDRTINADKIIANSITANEIDVEDIFAQDITATGTIRGATFIGGEIVSESWTVDSDTNKTISGALFDLENGWMYSPCVSWDDSSAYIKNLRLSGQLSFLYTEIIEDKEYYNWLYIREKGLEFYHYTMGNDGLVDTNSLVTLKIGNDYLSFSNLTNNTSLYYSSSLGLEVTNKSKFNGITSFYDEVTHYADLNCHNELLVKGLTTLQDSLDVTGATTLESTLNVKGNTIVGDSTATTYKGCYVQNSYRYGGLHVSEGGNLGVIDFGNNRWLIYQDSNGVNYIPSRTLVTGYIKNTGGNIIIGTNNNFLYGVSTAGSEYQLIGLNSSNQCDVAPTLANVVIGKAATNITIGKAGAAGQATGVTINDSVWINPYNNIVIKNNNCGLYGVKANTTNQYVHLIGVNTSNECLVGGDSALIKFGGRIQTGGGIEIQSASPYIDFHWNNSTSDYNVRLSNSESGALLCLGHLVPSADNTYNLGYDGKRWKQLFAKTSTISTSDRNLKYDFKEFDERYDVLYDLLKPYSYKFIDGESGRSHSGFVSQDVEEALQLAGLTALDFAGFCKDIKQKSVVVTPAEYDEEGNIISEAFYESVDDLDENGNLQYTYSLRYEEFIALNTNQIQKLKIRVNLLEEENRELKETINNILLRLQVLEERG